jgi:hypothetical protein
LNLPVNGERSPDVRAAASGGGLVAYVDEPIPGPRSETGVNFSPRLRWGLTVAAGILTLLPIAVARYGLLPVYQGHGAFLTFYAPFVCLLAVAYVIYVRDSLARLMFAHLLDPPPPPDEFEQDPPAVRLQRFMSEARRVALAALPGLLLLGSVACVIGYTTLLSDSVYAAARTDAERTEAPEEVGALSAGATAARTDGEITLRGQLPASNRATLPQRLLEVTPTNEIPYFTELTLLYIGAFLAPLLAVLLMGIREYAKDALGLTERDVVLGRLLVEPE